MKFYIDRITTDNYSKFDDMIYWRMNEIQRNPLNNKPNDAVANELCNPNLYVFAIGVGEIYIGWISLIYMPKVGKFNGHGHIYVDELWVEPSYRKKGYAKELMKKADEIKHALSATGIRLYVNTNNPNAQRLYEKCGFKEDGTAVYMTK